MNPNLDKISLFGTVPTVPPTLTQLLATNIWLSLSILFCCVMKRGTKGGAADRDGSQRPLMRPWNMTNLNLVPR
jgi:hypothetical protein